MPDQPSTLRERVQGIYGKLPEMECKGLCHTMCNDTGYTPAEEVVMREAHGRIPHLDTVTGRCTELTEENRCAIYEDRPMICRLAGMTKRMRCPHGCKPKEMVSDRKAQKLQGRLLSLSLELDNPKANEE